MTDVLVLVVTGIAVLAAEGGVLVVRGIDQRRRDARRESFRLDFPAGLDLASVTNFVRTLSSLGGDWRRLDGRASIVFELVATPIRIEYRLRLPAELSPVVLGQLEAALPAVGITPLSEPDAALPALTAAAWWRLNGPGTLIRTDQAESAAAAVLAGTRSMATGQALVLQLVVSPAHASGPDGLLDLLPGRPPGSSPSRKDQRDKSSEPLFRVAVRAGASGATLPAAGSLLRRLGATLRVVERSDLRFVRRRLSPGVVAQQVQAARTPLVEFGSSLNARELATVLFWPLGAPSVPGLDLGTSRRLSPSAAVSASGRVLGTGSRHGLERPIAITAADSLHHAHVIGPTGVGKSTLLANLIVQDLVAGRSLVVIDPKGDLVADVLDRVPESRLNDVVVLDPTDEERPVGLNLLHDAATAPELVTDAVVAIFHRLYAAYWGPRTSDMVTSALLTLCRRPGMTLCELPSVFTDDHFRRRLTAGLDDPVLLGFWAWYDALSPGERAAALGPVMNKLRAFLLRRRLRNVIGQADPTWSLRNVLNRQQVLLVNLAKGQLGSEAASLLGSLVVARLWQAIQVRTIRLPAMVVIDEFQDVVNLPTDLGDVLAQARGFGVGLTLAHQHLGQLSPSMRQAVLANARTKVAFQAAVDDAGVLARQLGGGLAPGDLQRLPRFEAYAAVCAGGSVQPPASLVTRPMPEALHTNSAVRAASRRLFGQDRTKVEAAIAARQQVGPPTVDASSDRRRRLR